jgi:hypothetical protein
MNGVRNMLVESEFESLTVSQDVNHLQDDGYLVTLRSERIRRDADTDVYLGQDSVSTEANQEQEYKILKFRPIREKLN